MMHLDLTAISGITGSVSIAAWCCVFTPQLAENFRRRSAEGLSVRFVAVWLTGDAFNILGGILQGVLPTMIILAVYYCLSDIVLISQCFYYKGFTLSDKPARKTSTISAEQVPNERSALLASTTDSAGATSNVSAPLPDEARHSSFRDQLVQSGTQLSPAVPMHKARRDDETWIGTKPQASRNTGLPIKAILFHFAAILVVCAAGVLGWWISTTYENPLGHRHQHKKPESHHKESALEFNILGQVFGYICAALYLGSRTPQLLLNYRRQSTEGISMLFFIFACIGNATYVASILAYEPMCYKPGHCEAGEAMSVYWHYILVNLSWLIGSFGTLLLDGCVFAQYFMYRANGLVQSNANGVE